MCSEVGSGGVPFGLCGVISHSPSIKVAVLGGIFGTLYFEDVRVDEFGLTDRYPLDFYASPEPTPHDWYQQFYSKKKKGGTKSYNRSNGKRRR